MSKYTEETLDKLLKKDLISIVLSQQTQMDAANSEIRARSLVVSDLRSETKGSRFESGC